MSLSDIKFMLLRSRCFIYPQGLVLPNLIHDGAQERNKRGGTENVASIVGLDNRRLLYI